MTPDERARLALWLLLAFAAVVFFADATLTLMMEFDHDR